MAKFRIISPSGLVYNHKKYDLNSSVDLGKDVSVEVIDLMETNNIIERFDSDGVHGNASGESKNKGDRGKGGNRKPT